MRFPPSRQQALSRCLIENSPHFQVHFVLRNPIARTSSLGRGADGVRNPALISYVIEALELGYRALTSTPFEFRRPRTDTTGKTFILINGRTPLTTLDLDGVPYVLLGPRSEEPLLQNALHRFAAEAVHETTHVFTWSARPPMRSYIEKRWRWFNEATAVYMEGAVYPGNLDTIRFYLNWSDLPEVSLDHVSAQYESGMFARYLAGRFKPSLISRLWMESTSEETPLDALRRLTNDIESTEDVCCIFGDYAHDSYFLWDSNLASFYPDVFFRFGTRAIAENFMLEKPGQTVTSRWRLDHLACRYFRIDSALGVRKITAVVSMPSEGAGAFRCFLSVSGRNGHRGPFVELKRKGNGGHSVALSGSISAQSLMLADHVCLTVANCGTRAPDYGDPNDDDRSFGILLRAE